MKYAIGFKRYIFDLESSNADHFFKSLCPNLMISCYCIYVDLIIQNFVRALQILLVPSNLLIVYTIFINSK